MKIIFINITFFICCHYSSSASGEVVGSDVVPSWKYLALKFASGISATAGTAHAVYTHGKLNKEKNKNSQLKFNIDELTRSKDDQKEMYVLKQQALKEELKEVSNKLKNSNQKILSARSKEHELNQEISGLKRAIESNANLNHLERNRLQRNIQQKEIEIAHIEGIIAFNQQDIEMQQQKYDRLLDTNERLLNANEKLLKRHAENIKIESDLEASVAAKQLEVERIMKELNNQLRKVDNQLEKSQRIQKSIELKLTNEIHTLENKQEIEIGNKNKQLQKYKMQHQCALEKMSNKNEEIKMQLIDSKHREENLLERYEKINKEITEYKNQYDDLYADNDELIFDLEEAKKRCGIIKKRESGYQDHIEDLEGQLADCKENMLDLKEGHQEISDQLYKTEENLLKHQQKYLSEIRDLKRHRQVPTSTDSKDFYKLLKTFEQREEYLSEIRYSKYHHEGATDISPKDCYRILKQVDEYMAKEDSEGNEAAEDNEKTTSLELAGGIEIISGTDNYGPTSLPLINTWVPKQPKLRELVSQYLGWRYDTPMFAEKNGEKRLHPIWVDAFMDRKHEDNSEPSTDCHGSQEYLSMPNQ